MAGTQPGDWRYVSEGGATVVFSYTGPPNSIFDNKVLRLRKSLPLGDADEVDDPVVEFQMRCTSRLIPSVHLPRLDFVSLGKEWLEDFIALHDITRPEERRLKGTIDASRTKAVLATDLVGGNWIAVEIKPKWAFLPSPKYLSVETCPIKTKTCRFCMHSRVRASQCEVQAVGYCPLDLFSGEEDRMRRAISSLWDAWVVSDGAINNLKIFVGGKVIKPKEESAMWVHTGGNFHNSDTKEAFTTALMPLLLHTPILQRISHLQRTLDPLDIEGLSRIWHSAESNGDLFLEPTMDEWDEFVDKFLSSEIDHHDHTELGPSNFRYYLLAYLFSATFKDCSLILRLDYLGSRPSNVEQERVSVIDLDRKSMSRLKKWERMDREIAEAYVTLGEDKICIDYLPS